MHLFFRETLTHPVLLEREKKLEFVSANYLLDDGDDQYFHC